MSGFSERLTLDVSGALRDIDRIEARLTEAAQRFQVEAFQAIDRLGSTPISLEVDTAGITTEVTRAVQSADTSVPVDADTAGLRREIDTFVPPEIDVPVDVDTRAARTELRALDTELDRTSGSAGLLVTTLAAVGTGAVVAAIRNVVDAFSAVEEQVSGAEVVFGNLADDVVSFAEGASNIGLATDEALRAANAFGLFAQNAGLAGEEASQFATTLVTRAADIASLRDLDLTETLERLRSGLTGETEPLRNLGIFLNEANVQAKALELGLTDLSGEVDDAGKIQARYALIMEQSAIAAGNYADTADGLANTQRTLSAEFRNALATIGEGVAPAFQELLSEGRELLPILTELGLTVLPALVELGTALAPAFGGFLSVATALGPPLEVLAQIVSSIPAPLLTAIGVLATLRSIAGPAQSAVTGLVSSFRGIGPSITAGNVALAAGALALTAYAREQQRAAERDANRANALSSLTSALQEGVSAQDALNRVVEGFSSSNDDFREGVDALGLTSSAFARAALGAGDLRSQLDALSQSRTRDADLSEGQVVAIVEQIDATRSAAEAQLALFAAQSESNAALVDQARASNTAADGTVDLFAALSQVNQEIQRQERENRRLIDSYEPLVQATSGLADAQAVLANESPEVSLLANAAAADQSVTSFLAFAAAADEAALSEEAMASAAAILGVDVESLAGFIETTTAALDDFVSSAASSLPTIGDVFDDALGRAEDAARELADQIREADPAGAQAIEDAARVTVEGLTISLATAAVELQTFRENLRRISEAGFADLAGLLAEQGVEAGGQLAQDLSDAVLEGNTALLEGLSFANDAFREESLATVEFIRSELAPQFLTATGLLATAVSETFGQNLTFEERVRIAGELAQTELDAQGQSIASVAAVEGEDAARAFGEALGLDQEAIDAAVAAGNAIRDNAPVEQGRQAGRDTTLGFAQGLSSPASINQVEAAAAAVARAAAAKIRGDLRIFSPSRVLFDLGAEVSEGFALGIASGVGRVSQSTSALSEAALVNTSSSVLVGGTAPAPGGIDTAGLISAVRDLAAKVGDTNTFNVSGPDPWSTALAVDNRLTSIKLRGGSR